MKNYKSLFILLALVITFLFIGCSQNTPEKPSAEADPEVMKKVEAALSSLAADAGSLTISDTEAAYEKLKSYLNNNDYIYGAAIAFAPADGKKSSPYVFRNGSMMIEKDLIESYDYTTEEWQWYAAPAKRGHPVWSEPYFDEGGGDVWMVTYSVPVYAMDDNTKLLAIVTSDVVLEE